MSRLVAILMATAVVGCGDDAATSPATPTPTRTPKRDPRLGPIGPVLARIDRYVDVTVALPDLPRGTLAFRKPTLGKNDGVRTAMLALRTPDGDHVQISYGIGGFDGCGPINPKRVRINGQPGIASRSRGADTVVWPTTDSSRNGTYAITATLPWRDVVALARSMDANGRSTSERGGC
jgi:hypothetical protein